MEWFVKSEAVLALRTAWCRLRLRIQEGPVVQKESRPLSASEVMNHSSIETPRAQRGGVLPASGTDKTIIAGVCVTSSLVLSAIGQEYASSNEPWDEFSRTTENAPSVFSEPELPGTNFQIGD